MEKTDYPITSWLFTTLEDGNMPNFLELMEALNEVSANNCDDDPTASQAAGATNDACPVSQYPPGRCDRCR